MKLRLNQNRPYAHVYGLPGIHWEQDGHYFHLDGSLHGDPVEVEAEVVTSSRPPKGSAEELSWVRSQLEIYGEPFTTMTAARRFLAGKSE